MGRQVLSDRESLPSWQMGSDKRFQYDFIKRTQGMPGPGLPFCPALHPLQLFSVNSMPSSFILP